MAFSDLASNQMVNENDASTGGFTAIGAKNPATQCYTKTQALAAYNLNASNMSAYAGNQLVPKSVWVSGAPPAPIMTPDPLTTQQQFGQSESHSTDGAMNTTQTFTFYVHTQLNGATGSITPKIRVNGSVVWTGYAITTGTSAADQEFVYTGIGAMTIALYCNYTGTSNLPSATLRVTGTAL
jgi:AraC-like DNA-binding protein